MRRLWISLVDWRALRTLLYASSLVALVLLGLRGWLRAGNLASPRLESVPELSIIWMARQRILEGGPLTEWAPYEFAGFPLVRFLCYPLYDAIGLLSIASGLTLELLFKVGFIAAFVTSALTMYAYARELTGQSAAAVVSGLAYALFPFHLHVGSEALVHAIYWALLPLAFLLYECSRKRPILQLRDAVPMGLLLGWLPILNSEHALLMVPFFGAFILLREGWLLWRRRHPWRALAIYWALTALIAIGLAAFYLLPAFMELKYVGIQLKHGGESFQSDELLRDYALSPALVWRAIVRRFGFSYTLSDPPVIAQAFWSIAWYPGVVVTLLAFWGAWHGRREPHAVANLVMLALAILFCLGSWLPGNPFPRVPFLGRLAPFRGMIFLGFTLSLMAGWGTRALLSRWSGKPPAWLPLAAALLLVFVDYWPATKALVTVPSYLPEDEIAAHRWISQQGEGYRSWEQATLHRDAYLRSYALKYDGARHLWGYYDNGAPRHMWALYSWGDLTTALTSGSVRYIITRPGKEDTLPADLAKLYNEQVWSSEHLRILENRSWLPYVRLYLQSALYLGDPEYRALDVLPELSARGIALASGPSDYADDYPLPEIARFQWAIVRDPWAREPAVQAQVAQAFGERLLHHAQVVQGQANWKVGPGAVAEGVSWRRPSPERIEVSVRSDRAALLTVSESWYPNWHVYVDGREQRTWRVNYAFLGVWIEPGEHEIAFRYEKPWYAWLGYALTAMTLLGVALCTLIHIPIKERI